jgi:hypothetical protein
MKTKLKLDCTEGRFLREVQKLQTQKGVPLFVDAEFPAATSSLIQEEDRNYAVKNVHRFKKGVQWLRAKNIPELIDPTGKSWLYEGAIEPNDIQQGQLEDCYFLASLSALAEWPERVQRLFLTQEANQIGIYAVTLYCNGQKMEVVIDDTFPCDKKTKQLRFSTSHGPELWVVILEKAWAKVHGSYESIESGNTFETIRDLTGAPGYYYYGWEEINDGLWSYILDFEKADYPMSCLIQWDEEDTYLDDDYRKQLSESLEELDDVGLVVLHAYSLLSACKVRYVYSYSTRLLLCYSHHLSIGPKESKYDSSSFETHGGKPSSTVIGPMTLTFGRITLRNKFNK